MHSEIDAQQVKLPQTERGQRFKVRQLQKRLERELIALLGKMETLQCEQANSNRKLKVS
jgi:hypothetical protein